MAPARQLDASPGDRLVARLSLRRFVPHAVVGLASVGFSGAAAASFGETGVLVLAVVLFGLSAIVLVAGGVLMARKLELIVDHQGIHCPGDALLVPWGDVVSLDLAGSVLRLTVRDGHALLARQTSDLSMWRPRRNRLTQSNQLAFPVGGLDRSPSEILDAATRLRGSGGVVASTGAEDRDARRQRLIITASAVLFVAQLALVALVYLS